MAIKKIGEATKASESFPETVSTIKDGMSGAVAGFEKTQTEVKLKMEKAMKTAEEMVSFSQGNLEAAVKSSQIWATGMQDLTKSLAASAQAHMDQTMSIWKALSVHGSGEQQADRCVHEAGGAGDRPADRPREPGRREAQPQRLIARAPWRERHVEQR
jgi:hypothetical protein